MNEKDKKNKPINREKHAKNYAEIVKRFRKEARKKKNSKDKS